MRNKVNIRPGLILLVLALCTPALAAPPEQPLDQAVNNADLVVVGKLGKLTSIAQEQVTASGEITVTQVLKGPADLKSVSLRTLDPSRLTKQEMAGEVHWSEGDEGVWILTKSDRGDNRYSASNSAHHQPADKIKEVKRLVELLSDANAATTQPTKVDGVVMTVTVRPKVTAVDDTIFFAVKFENVTRKAMPIYWSNVTDVSYHNLDTGVTWRRHQGMPPAAAPPRLSELAPKKPVVQQWVITGTTVFVREDEGEAAKGVLGLPAGRYELNYKTQFLDVSPDKNSGAFTGQIEAKPVRFEIREAVPETQPATKEPPAKAPPKA